MIAQSAFRRAKREMMLHAVAGENFNGAVVHVDGQRDSQGALGKFQALAVTGGNLEMLGNDVKLPTRHLESRVRIDFHIDLMT